MKTGPKPKTKAQAVEQALKEARRDGDCLLRETKATVGDGYKLICCEGAQFFAHRLVYEMKTGEKLKTADVVRHTCDRPNCINFDHLIKGTHNDNVQDKVSKLRHGFGIKHYASKLTEADVLRIRSMIKPNFGQLAQDHKMAIGALKSMYYGHTWKHLPVREQLMQTRAQETLTYIKSEDFE